MNGIDQDNIEIINEFVQDCRDLLDDLEVSVLSLEREMDENAPDGETINTIFRTFHSIKGGASFLLFNNIKDVAHASENLLDLVRAEKLPLLKEHIDLFVLSSDFIKDAIEKVAADLSDEEMKDQAFTIINTLSYAMNQEKTFPLPGDPPLPPDQRNDDIDTLLKQVEKCVTLLLGDDNNRTVQQALSNSLESLRIFGQETGSEDLAKLFRHMEMLGTAISSDAPINVGQGLNTLLQLIDIVTDLELSECSYGEIQGIDLYIELIRDMLPKDFLAQEDEKKSKLGSILVEKGVISTDKLDEALNVQKKPLGEILVEMGAADKEEIDEALKEQRTREVSQVKKQIAPTREVKRQDIRVNISKLDSLINLIGELVIANNMIIHNPDLDLLSQAQEMVNFNKAASHMAKIVRELQETAVNMRMIPVMGLFRKMMRLVHDLSNKSGKKVSLRLEGEETELDKTVIELITDPLVHIIRNSIDHGLESEEERRASGKEGKGNVTLRASHEEGEIWIVVEDDGKGIDRDKVLKKAIDQGLIDPDNIPSSDRDIYSLIFHPGFSTAEKITDISGRGVGMDVVKKNLDRISGKVDIHSTPGKGTKVILRIPLTLAIIDGMMVRVGQSHYIIPILSIKEFFKPQERQITVSPDGTEIVKLRNELLPILRLHQIYGIRNANEKLSNGILVVVESEKRQSALFVDEIIGQQQTVIKGLSEYIGKIHGISGCTILGDGGISLILDIDSLIEGVKNDFSGGEA